MKSCPTSINVPKFIKQIATENVKGSAHTIFSSNIMGAGCSKVCPVEKLCEGACVYNLMHEEPINIARLQRYSTEKAMANQWQLFERKPSKGKRVAIIGAGPVGLSCAHTLSREGIEVTIYEREAKGATGVQYVFPAQLDQSLKVVNKQLNISYNPTEQSHQFVLCPKGHIYDPFNPDYQYMPVVNLCSAKNKS